MLWISRANDSTWMSVRSVPAEVRRRLGVGPGSVLEWDVEGEDILVRPVGRYTPEEMHQALFATPPRRRSLKELKRGIRNYIQEQHARR